VKGVLVGNLGQVTLFYQMYSHRHMRARINQDFLLVRLSQTFAVFLLRTHSKRLVFSGIVFDEKNFNPS